MALKLHYLYGDVQMENEKRSEPRLEKQLLVNISKNDGFESMGITSNISKEGMFISTREMLPLNSEVSILIGIEDETITLKGQVIWSHELSNGNSGDVQNAAGIKIIEAPDRYFIFLDQIYS